MKLYVVPVAPNPTKVRLYLAEKAALGVDLAIEQCTVKLMKGEQNKPEHLARNPFAAIPVLELAEGDYITESLAIIEYLEECYPQPSMIGNTQRERARARELERIIDLRLLVPIARFVHATKSPLGLPAKPQVADDAARVVPVALAYLEALLGDQRRFFLGDEVCVADCTLAAALQFARFGGYAIESGYRNLHRWDADYRQRSIVADIFVA